MKTRQFIISTYIITATVVILFIVLISINYKRMKQSIQGTLSKSYFTIDELCASQTAKQRGINNTPTPEVQSNLQLLIDQVLNPARQAYGSYIRVSSGYRCPALNAAVGGAASSQHLTGQAADITTGNITTDRQLFAILVSQAHFDQLIWEQTKNGRWIHVSYSTAHRQQILAYNGKQYTNIKANWQAAIA